MIEIKKILCQVDEKWKIVEPSYIDTTDKLEGLIIVTKDNRKFKLTEIVLNRGKND